MGGPYPDPHPGMRLSRKERRVLFLIECQDDVDVAKVAAEMGISNTNMRATVKAIRVKLEAPAADYWLEELPARAREKGQQLTDEMPDDGSIKVDDVNLGMPTMGDHDDEARRIAAYNTEV